MKRKTKSKKIIIGTSILVSSILFISMGYTLYSKNVLIESKDKAILEIKEKHVSETMKYKTTIDDMRLESNKMKESLDKEIEKKTKEVTDLKKKLAQSIKEEEIEIKEIEAAKILEEQRIKNEQKVKSEKTQPNNVPTNNDNWHKKNRRIVESGDNYNTFTSNGYLGAYQFAPVTWNSIAARHGLDPSDFSPSNQDRFADIYATERYGGWQNVPTIGGW